MIQKQISRLSRSKGKVYLFVRAGLGDHHVNGVHKGSEKKEEREGERERGTKWQALSHEVLVVRSLMSN